MSLELKKNLKKNNKILFSSFYDFGRKKIDCFMVHCKYQLNDKNEVKKGFTN